MEKLSQMLDLALKIRERAYAPYSEFKVGAVVCSDKGNLFCGCNVENASYPCGTCAEAAAIAAMVAAGERHIAAVLVAADCPDIVPCGNCLQKIAEFGDADTIICSADLTHIVFSRKLKDLMPHNFSAEAMLSAKR